MTRLHDLMHQTSLIKDYRDKISSSLYQTHRIITTHFPELSTKSIEDMSRILDTTFQEQIVNILNDINSSVYRD
jgi:hypothetical protein